MNQPSFDEPNEFPLHNRLTEYFRRMDEESASRQNDPEESSGKGKVESEVTRESNAASEWFEDEGDPEIENTDCDGSSGSSGESESRYSPEDMLTPQFFDACYLSHLRGRLPSFLSGVGIGSAEEVARVQSLFDQRFPTIHEESDYLFGLIEQELVQVCLGGCTRVGDFTEDGFVLDAKSEDRRFRAMELLTFVRLRRLEFHTKRSE